jgi:hypothetical protein
VITRDFITLLGGAAAWPVAARAQQPDRMRLIGVLMAYAESDLTAQSWLAAFRAALAKLGRTEGSNLRIELRWSAARGTKLPRTSASECPQLAKADVRALTMGSGYAHLCHSMTNFAVMHNAVLMCGRV